MKDLESENGNIGKIMSRTAILTEIVLYIFIYVILGVAFSSATSISHGKMLIGHI